MHPWRDLPTHLNSRDIQTQRAYNGGAVRTLAVLAVLVSSSDGVHAVARGAVCGGTVGLRGGQTVHTLDGV